MASHVHVHVSVRFQVSYHVQVSCLFHMAFQILVWYDVYPHIIQIFLSLYEFILLEIGIISIGSSELKLWHFHAKLVNLSILHWGQFVILIF